MPLMALLVVAFLIYRESVLTIPMLPQVMDPATIRLTRENVEVRPLVAALLRKALPALAVKEATPLVLPVMSMMNRPVLPWPPVLVPVVVQ